MTRADATTYYRRLHLAEYLLVGLGYPLAQVFAQQAGLHSEGLDVTKDINVAIFFAKNKFAHNKYTLATNEEVGIIYRWKIESDSLLLSNLNEFNFYSCHNFIDSLELFKQFEKCESLEDCKASINEYRMAIGWGVDFSIDYVRDNRPFKILRFPFDAYINSRIVRQSACLLIPDQVLNKHWEKIYHKAPDGTTTDMSNSLLEDLSCSRNVSKYLFKHSQDDVSLIEHAQDEIFPPNDIACETVRSWYRTYNVNPRNPFQLVMEVPFLAKLFGHNIFSASLKDPSEMFIL
jgi:hypothetical protein